MLLLAVLLKYRKTCLITCPTSWLFNKMVPQSTIEILKPFLSLIGVDKSLYEIRWDYLLYSRATLDEKPSFYVAMPQLFSASYIFISLTLFNVITELLGASEVSANLYCNSRTSVLWRLRDYLRLLMKRSVFR